MKGLRILATITVLAIVLGLAYIPNNIYITKAETITFSQIVLTPDNVTNVLGGDVYSDGSNIIINGTAFIKEIVIIDGTKYVFENYTKIRIEVPDKAVGHFKVLAPNDKGMKAYNTGSQDLLECEPSTGSSTAYYYNWFEFDFSSSTIRNYYSLGCNNVNSAVSNTSIIALDNEDKATKIVLYNVNVSPYEETTTTTTTTSNTTTTTTTNPFHANLTTTPLPENITKPVNEIEWDNIIYGILKAYKTDIGWLVPIILPNDSVYVIMVFRASDITPIDYNVSISGAVPWNTTQVAEVTFTNIRKMLMYVEPYNNSMYLHVVAYDSSGSKVVDNLVALTRLTSKWADFNLVIMPSEDVPIYVAYHSENVNSLSKTLLDYLKGIPILGWIVNGVQWFINMLVLLINTIKEGFSIISTIIIKSWFYSIVAVRWILVFMGLILAGLFVSGQFGAVISLFKWIYDVVIKLANALANIIRALRPI